MNNKRNISEINFVVYLVSIILIFISFKFSNIFISYLLILSAIFLVIPKYCVSISIIIFIINYYNYFYIYHYFYFIILLIEYLFSDYNIFIHIIEIITLISFVFFLYKQVINITNKNSVNYVIDSIFKN